MTPDDLPEAFQPRDLDSQCCDTHYYDAQGYNDCLEATKAADLWRENQRLRADLTHSEANRNANLSAANVALARAEQAEADRARLRSAVQKHLKDGYNAQGGWDGLIEALADTDPEESQ